MKHSLFAAATARNAAYPGPGGMHSRCEAPRMALYSISAYQLHDAIGMRRLRRNRNGAALPQIPFQDVYINSFL